MPDVHVFRPDHNLYCRDCGDGELMGNHGIIAIEEGRQIYLSPQIEEMYDAHGPVDDDDDVDDDDVDGVDPRLVGVDTGTIH